jgi:uracil DNA glycosylase
MAGTVPYRAHEVATHKHPSPLGARFFDHNAAERRKKVG